MKHSSALSFFAPAADVGVGVPGLRTDGTYSIQTLTGPAARPRLATTNQSGADRRPGRRRWRCRVTQQTGHASAVTAPAAS